MTRLENMRPRDALGGFESMHNFNHTMFVCVAINFIDKKHSLPMLRVLHRIFRLELFLPISHEDRAGPPPFCLSTPQRSRPTF